MKRNSRSLHIMTLLALGLLVQTPIEAQTSPQTELPKVPEAVNMGIGYTQDGRGKVRGADENGKVYQYFLIWENEQKAPDAITYLLVGKDRTAFTATWGRGPVNLKAFGCGANDVPQYGEKVLWVATVVGDNVMFQEIKNDDLKALFQNLAQARRDYSREVSASSQRSKVNLTEQNVLYLMKEKNRKKWLEQGWLQPATACIKIF